MEAMKIHRDSIKLSTFVGDVAGIFVVTMACQEWGEGI